ncbi:hypothetical protein EDD29_2963 [Actinocorallia herbida]|uniref:Uncharacterized protein n=1 Tax=Actinocorallia herbida TaxID=58109 RepID=A0A3N1CVU6_9ACTN|nr:hypothetical protein [Actinocorallia herbida]ROO85419.1 hypothetical protein EDD29_2963 [Actinocorallia herbida]
MALGWKVVFDAAEPYRPAVFRAGAPEHVVEDNSALIERLPSVGGSTGRLGRHVA